MSENRDQEFIEYVVKSLVDHPESVKVERKIDEMGVLITLDVHQEDMGMVIGREGMTAKALRTLLRVIGAKNNARVNLKINEPEGSTRGERKDPSLAPAAATEPQAPSEPAVAEETSERMEEPKKTLEEVMNDIRI